MTATTAIALNDFDMPALERQAYPLAKIERSSVVSHSATPPSHPKHVMEQHPMSSDYSTNPLGKRIADALWRRINAGAITRAHIKHALNCSTGTVDNLLSGNREPSSRILMGLLSLMDTAFANEILAPTGCRVAKISDRRAEVFERYIVALRELRTLDGV